MPARMCRHEVVNILSRLQVPVYLESARLLYLFLSDGLFDLLMTATYLFCIADHVPAWFNKHMDYFWFEVGFP